MKETKFTLRLNKREKDSLKSIVVKNGMTITDYIKYRLFYNNPEITEEKFIYESPSKDKHNYLLMGVLQDIYLLMSHFIGESRTQEELKDLKAFYREQARKNIASYGYLKVEADE